VDLSFCIDTPLAPRRIISRRKRVFQNVEDDKATDCYGNEIRGKKLFSNDKKEENVVQIDDDDSAIQGYRNGEEVNFKVHLGSNYYVTLKSGYSLVHIRRWYIPENEKELRPTKKGIALSFEQWSKLTDAMIVVEELLGK